MDKDVNVEKEINEAKYKNIKKRSLNIYVRRSFFYILVCFITCGVFLILSSSKVYKKQREVTQIKNEISKATQELESLQLEILNLKGFDRVMEYAEYLNMNPPKLGESVFANLNNDNFGIEEEDEPDKPLIVKIYEKIFNRKN